MKSLFCLFFILLSSGAFAQPLPPVLAEDGILNLRDLQDSKLEKSGIISLEGEWAFYENLLLTPSELIPNKKFISCPGVWERYFEKDIHYATLALQIQGLEPGHPYTLFVPEILTAHRIWIDGIEYLGNGRVAKTPKQSIPQFLPRYHNFVASQPNITIQLQISNFDYRKSGIWRSLTLASIPVMAESRVKSYAIEFIVLVILFVVGAYHISLGFYRKQERAELYFGLICILLGLRLIATGNQFLTVFIPNISWEFTRRLEFLPFYLLGFIVLRYIESLFSLYVNSRVKKVFDLFFLGFSLIFIFFPVRISNYFILPGELVLCILLLYCIIVLLRAFINKEEGAKAILIAIVAILLTLINDVLFANQIISTLYLSHIGFIVFITVQSQMLTQRFAKAFNQAQSLSEELKNVNKSLSRFVPFQFLKYLDKQSIIDVELGDQVNKHMTIFFADIRSFTSLSEMMTPEENFKFLNSYLSQVVSVIKDNNGFVDKFIGDGIMALFPKDPDDAVKAAIDLQRQVDIYNTNRAKMGYRAISVGVGVHCGDLILGTIGEKNRMETTVISDTVNVAARLETLTKLYKAPILISYELYTLIKNKEKFKFRFLGEAKVRGREGSEKIVEVLMD